MKLLIDSFNKDWMDLYNSIEPSNIHLTPLIKKQIRSKLYNSSPEVKNRLKKYMKSYFKRDYVRERRRLENIIRQLKGGK